MPCLPDDKKCFKCHAWFHKDEAVLCKCDQYVCPICKACFCSVSSAVKRAVEAMQDTYDEWIKAQGLSVPDAS